MPYDTLDDAIDLIRRHPSPLVIYWFGETIAGFDTMMARTASGAVSVNETLLRQDGGSHSCRFAETSGSTIYPDKTKASREDGR